MPKRDKKELGCAQFWSATSRIQSITEQVVCLQAARSGYSMVTAPTGWITWFTEGVSQPETT